MDLVSSVQSLVEAVCVSLGANSLAKVMNPFLLPLTIGK